MDRKQIHYSTCNQPEHTHIHTILSVASREWDKMAVRVLHSSLQPKTTVAVFCFIMLLSGNVWTKFNTDNGKKSFNSSTMNTFIGGPVNKRLMLPHLAPKCAC